MMLLQEIILQILEDLYTVDFKTFRACIYVNSVWCQLAIPILWRNPWEILEYMGIDSTGKYFIRTIIMFLNDKEHRYIENIAKNFDIKWACNNESTSTLPYPSFIHSLNANLFSKITEDWLQMVDQNYKEKTEGFKEPEKFYLQCFLLNSLFDMFVRYDTSFLDLFLDLSCSEYGTFYIATLLGGKGSTNKLVFNKLVLKSSINNLNFLFWIKYVVRLDLTICCYNRDTETDLLCTFLQSTKGIQFLQITFLGIFTSDKSLCSIIHNIRQFNLPTLKRLQLGIIITGLSTLKELCMIPTNILSLENCLFTEEIVDVVPDYMECTDCKVISSSALNRLKNVEEMFINMIVS